MHMCHVILFQEARLLDVIPVFPANIFPLCSAEMSLYRCTFGLIFFNTHMTFDLITEYEHRVTLEAINPFAG